MMKIIVSLKKPDGSYVEYGTLDRIIFSHYKTIKGAVKFGAKRWANGKAFRVEIYPAGNVYEKCNWVLYFDQFGSRIN